VRRSSLLVSSFVVVATLAGSGTRASAQQAPPPYERRELSIPVRDGVHLFAVALIPRDATEPLPILMIRTPYSAANYLRGEQPPANLRELAKDGYIFVVEDIRGRFGSGGDYVMNRAQNDPRNPPGTNESTDTYDTIDWLVKNLPNNNGKVGVTGISYPGWLAGVAGVGAHPALKAISPQAPMTDTWLGDDFFHQGAFRLTQGLEYVGGMEGKKGGFADVPMPEHDHYEFYLRYPTLDSIARATGIGRLASWIDFRTHPTYDAFWQARAMQNVLTKPEVPVLFVGGFWDQEDILGPQLGYAAVEKADTKGWNHIVLGPWFHGGWARVAGDSLGPIAFGTRTGDYFLANIERPWWAYWLHGKGDGRFPEAIAFETGENAWHTFDTWPPPGTKEMWIRLESGGRLVVQAPARGSETAGPRSGGHPAANAAPSAKAAPPLTPSRRPAVSPSAVSAQTHGPDYDSYVSDPAHPIPYMPRPDDGSGWRTWLERDQRFVHNRPDVLTWESQPLGEDLTIAGDVVAHLFASTTGTDADWVVKLIDVYPDSLPDDPRMAGYQLMVNADIMRGRYWKGFTKATPIPANTVTPFTVDMHEQLYRFRKGHRLMVQVQSTWFPLYDRNPQTFVPNIFDARPGDYRAQEHRVWHTGKYPSHITVGVLE